MKPKLINCYAPCESKMESRCGICWLLEVICTSNKVRQLWFNYILYSALWETKNTDCFSFVSAYIFQYVWYVQYQAQSVCSINKLLLIFNGLNQKIKILFQYISNIVYPHLYRSALSHGPHLFHDKATNRLEYVFLCNAIRKYFSYYECHQQVCTVCLSSVT